MFAEADDDENAAPASPNSLGGKKTNADGNLISTRAVLTTDELREQYENFFLEYLQKDKVGLDRWKNESGCLPHRLLSFYA